MFIRTFKCYESEHPVYEKLQGKVLSSYNSSYSYTPALLDTYIPRTSKEGESSRARLSRSFIRRLLTRTLPLKITDAGRVGAEKREIKKEYEKHL